jgi:hypothetical protein
VSWGPAVGGPAVDMYAVLAWDAGGYANHSATVCATCTAASVPGLTNGHRYYFTVYGHDGAGWGAPGSSGWVTVGAVPGSPTGVTIAPGNAALTATWGVPATAATAVDGYAVLAYDANGYTNQYSWVCATCMTGNVAGLVNGHSYYALVYAHNVNGWSAPVTTASIVAGTPGSPGSVSVTPASRSVNATWAPATSAASPIDMYAVLAFDSSGYTGLSSTACATCTAGGVTGLTSGKTYTIWVYARNAQGWGVPTTSAPVTAA